MRNNLFQTWHTHARASLFVYIIFMHFFRSPLIHRRLRRLCIPGWLMIIYTRLYDSLSSQCLLSLQVQAILSSMIPISSHFLKIILTEPCSKNKKVIFLFIFNKHKAVEGWIKITSRQWWIYWIYSSSFEKYFYLFTLIPRTFYL